MTTAKCIKTSKNCVNLIEMSKKGYKQAEGCGLSSTMKSLSVEETVGNNNDDHNKDLPTSNNRTNSFVRQKPQIQLPLNPQIPSNTKRLNPQYSYRKLAEVKSKALLGDLARVNMFVVVHDVFKSLTRTENGKYTIICKVVDESMEGALSSFDLHFFTPEEMILKQINQGDVLRLHRVKIEIFQTKVDGRIFFSHDVVLFKNNFPHTAPITVFKNFHASDEERKRVINLQKWYIGALEREMKEKTRLGDICQEGEYNIVCKVLDVQAHQGLVTILVTDGSEITRLSPSLPLPHHTTPRLVTEINVYHKHNEYLKLQANDIVYFVSVKAIRTNKLTLVINERVYPLTIHIKTESVMEIKGRMKMFENEDTESPNDMEIIDEDSEIFQTGQVSSDKPEVVTDEEHHPRTSRKDTLRNKSITKDKDVHNSYHHENKYSVKEKPPKISKKPEKEAINDNEAVKDTDNLAVKTRKTLFTPNYTDLSDATDETSENLESLTQFRTESGKGTTTQVVNPANTGFCELIEIVKTKYCSPRRLSPEGVRPQSSSCNADDKNKGEKSVKDKMLPFVKLAKLTEKDFNKLSEGRANQNETTKTGNPRKRTLDVSTHETSLDNLEEASTIVNYSLQKNSPNDSKHHKRARLESESTVLGCTDSLAPNENTSISHENLSQESRDQKVTNWLFHPNNRLHSNTRLEMNQREELPFEVVKQLLLGQETTSEDLSKCIENRKRRMKVFLLDILPDPLAEPLDMVSGYCLSGCHNVFIFSKIHWVANKDSMIPYCPDCFELEQEKKLELMLVFQLLVMDQKGNILAVLVCKEHAANFMNCSVRDFLKNSVIRASRCQLLTENTFKSVPRPNPVPLLDITVVKMENTLCVVNSFLKLPPCP